MSEINVESIDLRIFVVFGSFLALNYFSNLRVFNLICGDLSFNASTIYFYRSSIVIDAVIAFNVANVSSTMSILLSFNLR